MSETSSGSTSGGGTTINYREGVATTPGDRETEIGGMTEGDVTLREGAAEGARSGESQPE